jgi:hypothetical protein
MLNRHERHNDNMIHVLITKLADHFIFIRYSVKEVTIILC